MKLKDKKSYWLFVNVIIIIISPVNLWSSEQGNKGSTERLNIKEIDVNKDGENDNWVYYDDKGIPVEWVSDSDKDGKSDTWAIFREGKAYVDQRDTDKDGRVDEIVLHIFNNEKDEIREISLFLNNHEKNVFKVKGDTDWMKWEKDEDGFIKWKWNK